PVTELISSEDALEYVWSTGATTKSITIDKEGLYWVMNIHNCRVHIDSFRTQLADMGLDWGDADTTICEGHSIVIDAYHPDIQSYKWNTGATSNSVMISAAGTYHLTAFTGDCYV